MRRLSVRLAWALVLVFLGCIGLATSLVPPGDPQTIDDLQAFLGAPACAESLTPCWLGIRPGETTVSEARALLEAHPYVARVREWTSPGPRLLVTWSDQSPPFLSQSPVGGWLDINRQTDTIQSITLEVRIPLADLWLVAGRASRIMSIRPAIVVTPRPSPTPLPNQPPGTPAPYTPYPVIEPYTIYRTYHPQLQVWATAYAECPQGPYNLWSSTVQTLELFTGSSGEPDTAIDWNNVYRTPVNCMPLLFST